MLYSILSITGLHLYIVAISISAATAAASRQGIIVEYIDEVTEGKEEIYELL